MSAYFVVDLEITDPAGFEAYRGAVPALIAKYDGRYLVRGGAFEVLESDWCWWTECERIRDRNRRARQ